MLFTKCSHLSLNAKKNPREVSIEQEGPQFVEWERKQAVFSSNH